MRVSYLDRIKACNNARLDGHLPLRIGGHRLGRVAPGFASVLEEWPELFIRGGDTIDLDPAQTTAEARSAAVAEVFGVLNDRGLIHGWHDELYAVKAQWSDPPVMLAERAALPYLGLRSYGVHLTGYVPRADGIHIWVARRARDRANYPGMLDNTVAGGQPHDLTLMENLVKECGEEAAIPPSLAQTATAVGHVSYVEQPDPLRVKPDCMFCYDLELSADFVPRNTDGEIESFELMPAAEVMGLVRDTEEFKPNCAVVLIDFFVRRGLLGPQDDADYEAITAGLRAGG